MCKFKTGTNTDYNKKAGFNFISFYNKLYIYFLPWFVLHKNVVHCNRINQNTVHYNTVQCDILQYITYIIVQ